MVIVVERLRVCVHLPWQYTLMVVGHSQILHAIVSLRVPTQTFSNHHNGSLSPGKSWRFKKVRACDHILYLGVLHAVFSIILYSCSTVMLY